MQHGGVLVLGFLALGSQGCSYAGVWQASWTFGVGWKLNPPHILCRSRLAPRSLFTLDQAHQEGQASSCTTLGRDFTNCLQRKWWCLGSKEASEPLHTVQRCNCATLVHIPPSLPVRYHARLLSSSGSLFHVIYPSNRLVLSDLPVGVSITSPSYFFLFCCWRGMSWGKDGFPKKKRSFVDFFSWRKAFFVLSYGGGGWCFVGVVVAVASIFLHLTNT
ncbi:uncharacterized protein BDZ83DRAFT_350241 [Colletotrichum acutatum]|uniref:Secreted protein n=1 Tax=Glomerella acutata TaxID=27357 RepID=A0AAD8UQ83_GLOAC|nr:uncharacterized protein BDZ83DRAFT_350241 [Colletotrichum acutatum]KAK1724480.1 hypothetical protein BDZ83DRAFT_350241 [Colletotrichum acutatum]